MEITWGFLVFFLFLVFPGLIVRRLFFFSEFSKQFGYTQPLLKTLSYSIVPGFINLIIAYFTYNYLIQEIELESIFLAYKYFDSGFNSDAVNIDLNEAFENKVIPFIGMTFLSAAIIGTFSGRLIRLLGLDTKWKIFRFKNHWFYLFSNHHSKLKKYKDLENPNKKYLFTKADVLVDSNTGTHLYSGIILDYELQEDNCSELSKIVLRNAHRYKDEQGSKIAKRIPGKLFVVDCKNLINLNLQPIFGGKEVDHKMKFRKTVYYLFTLMVILLIPVFIFEFEIVPFSYYHDLFDMSIFSRFIGYLWATQVVHIFNPYTEESESKSMVKINLKLFFFKFLLLAFFSFLMFLILK